MKRSYLKHLFFSLLGRHLGIKTKGNYIFHGLDSATPLLDHKQINISPESLYPLIPDCREEHKAVLYICSPTQRSGTNFIANILSQSEELYPVSTTEHLSEQFVYSHADKLAEYISQTTAYWGKWLKYNDLKKQQLDLFAHIGDGIVGRFSADQRVPLLRTPDAGNLDYFFPMFPNGQLVVIIRDGRDTVDSFIKSFADDWAFRKMCARWAERVDLVYDLKEILEKSGLSQQIHFVKYEDLNTNPKPVMEDLLPRLGLDVAKYNWNQLSKIPVVGSSTIYEEKHKDFWQEKEKQDASKFSNKWRSWTPGKRKIFKRIAGSQLIRAGYEEDSDW
jgi:hypothetical protein